MSDKKTRKRCFACKFASPAFKAYGQTHHHCEHPKHTEGIKNPSAWDTLVEWHYRCKQWEDKRQQT